MAWRGSISRSIASTARAAAFRSAAPISGTGIPRPPSVASSRFNPRRLSLSNPRTLGELGGALSLMPLHSLVVGGQLTSHLAVNLRAYCELSHGT